PVEPVGRTHDSIVTDSDENAVAIGNTTPAPTWLGRIDVPVHAVRGDSDFGRMIGDRDKDATAESYVPPNPVRYRVRRPVYPVRGTCNLAVAKPDNSNIAPVSVGDSVPVSVRGCRAGVSGPIH